MPETQFKRGYYSVDDFNERLYKTLYCSNDLEFGIRLRRKTYALTHDYIQFNDLFIKFLVLDIDRPSATYDWENSKVAPPHFVVINRENGHCHYIYALEMPICKTDNARLKPLTYFAKIQQAYTLALNADKDFAGLLTKNPNSAKWHVAQFAFEPYTLDYLADFVDLPKRLLKREVIAEGRNCYLFEIGRRKAYREVLFYKKHGANVENFQAFIANFLEKNNVFENSSSLPWKEVHNIAKSIAKWTWRDFSESKFSEIQTARGKRRAEQKRKCKAERIQTLGELL